MTWNRSNIDNLQRIFTESLVARDIAEPIVSFDASTPASVALAAIDARGIGGIGVRVDGLVAGYALREDLEGATCGERMRPIDEAQWIADSASLADVVVRLAVLPRLFVRVLGTVAGIITKTDLEKPPVRMWLFGMVTVMEIRLTRLIERRCEGESWRQYLSEGRLSKAEELLQERRRRNQNVRLLDCLQFSDRGQIVARDESLRGLTRFSSRRKLEEAVKAMESLRNNLAHSQDIVSCDWELIVVLAREVENVVRAAEGVRQVLEE